jgi:CheY-like chemotaxis protein
MSRILVIDDDEPFRTLVGTLLAGQGYMVEWAVGGNEGLKVCHTHPVDLILIDLMMPSKDGIETIQEIHRDFPNMKVIVISGGLLKDSHPKMSLSDVLGVQTVLSKPLSTLELLSSVREALGEAHAQ